MQELFGLGNSLLVTNRAIGRILLGWVQAPEARGCTEIWWYILLVKFEKSSCGSPLFLHSVCHFNLPSDYANLCGV